MSKLGLQSVPQLRRGIIRKFDAVRNQFVLLAPERVIVLDDIGDAIVQCCDGQRTLAQIVAILAERYAAEPAQVATDVLEFAQELYDKGLV